MKIYNEVAISMFGKKLATEIESTTDYRVDIREVNKVNLGTLHGLTLREQERSGKTDVSPTFYLEDFADSFFSKEKNIQQIAREIVNLHIGHKPKGMIDMSWVLNFDKVKDFITYRFIKFLFFMNPAAYAVGFLCLQNHTIIRIL